MKVLPYFNRIKCSGLGLGSIVPFFSENAADKVEVGAELLEAPDDDGWQRLRRMFEINEFGELSKELTTVSQTAMLSSFVGVIYGGVLSSRTAYTDFMRNNTAATFKSHFEAKRKLQDTITKSLGKGGWKWGWRLCIFSTTFVGLTTTISVYRGKNGILEYVLAGAGTGALYKWQMGPRGWIIGGGLGAVLGLTSGTLTYGLLKLSGLSMDEVRERQQSFGKYRKSFIDAGMRDYMDKEDSLLRSHNEKMNATKTHETET